MRFIRLHEDTPTRSGSFLEMEMLQDMKQALKEWGSREAMQQAARELLKELKEKRYE